MKLIFKFCAPGTILSLLFLCSCATEHSVSQSLPAYVNLNHGAGRGDEILVTLHMENGPDMLFLLDTGATSILLDKSLEPKLGMCFWSMHTKPWYGMQHHKLYRAPKLYLGDTELQTSGWVFTDDLTTFSNAMAQSAHTNRPIMGILGMSCLKHYCLQLDFATGKLHFLDAAHADKQQWGKAFALKNFAGCFVVQDNFLGAKGQNTLIDTGCNFDGWLTPKLFQQWTNQTRFLAKGETLGPGAVLGGVSYPHVSLNGDGVFNGMGLYFLARHLVTLDFPHRTMYLKQTSADPLIDDDAKQALKFLGSLRTKGQLPGWAKDDQGQVSVMAYPTSGILDAWKNGDSKVYHYAISGGGTDKPMKLERAWLTDQKGKNIEEFKVL